MSSVVFNYILSKTSDPFDVFLFSEIIKAKSIEVMLECKESVTIKVYDRGAIKSLVEILNVYGIIIDDIENILLVILFFEEVVYYTLKSGGTLNNKESQSQKTNLFM